MVVEWTERHMIIFFPTIMGVLWRLKQKQKQKQIKQKVNKWNKKKGSTVVTVQCIPKECGNSSSDALVHTQQYHSSRPNK